MTSSEIEIIKEIFYEHAGHTTGTLLVISENKNDDEYRASVAKLESYEWLRTLLLMLLFMYKCHLCFVPIYKVHFSRQRSTSYEFNVNTVCQRGFQNISQTKHMTKLHPIIITQKKNVFGFG